MNYAKIITNGIIIGIANSKNELPNMITEQEALNLQHMFLEKPEAPEGFHYDLTTDFEWILKENPIIEEDATAEDYQNALEQMGVNFNENA